LYIESIDEDLLHVACTLNLSMETCYMLLVH